MKDKELSAISTEISDIEFEAEESSFFDEPSSNKRRRLDELLEEKRLRSELNEFNDYYGSSRNAYDDDYLNQFDNFQHNNDDYY